MKLEKILKGLGYKNIIGVDECNVFSLAGYIIACAIIMDLSKPIIKDIKDSKLLTRKKREKLFPLVKKRSKFISIGKVYPREINQLGIYLSHILAKQRAIINIIKKLRNKRGIVIICDGAFNLKLEKIGIGSASILAFPNADQKVYSVSCASIIAKVLLDRSMARLHKKYPMYQWDRNTGCPTKAHYKAIYDHGLVPIWHRENFCKQFPQLKEFFYV